MKSFTAVGCIALGLAANVAAHRHEHIHEKFHMKKEEPVASGAACSVSYYTTTTYGEWALVDETSAPPSPSSSSEPAPPPPPSSSEAPVSYSSSEAPLPPSSSEAPPSYSSSEAPLSSPSTISASAPPPPPPKTSSSSSPSSSPPPPPPAPSSEAASSSSTPPPPPPSPSSEAAPSSSASAPPAPSSEAAPSSSAPAPATAPASPLPALEHHESASSPAPERHEAAPSPSPEHKEAPSPAAEHKEASSPAPEHKEASSPTPDQHEAAPPPAPEQPAKPSSQAAPPASSPSSSSGSGSAGAISPNGNQWAFCYTPYTSSGQCKSAGEVSSDIASIKAKGFTSVRTYGADCSGIQNIGNAARANGLKIILGVDIDASGIGSKTDAEISSTAQWGSSNWDLVELVVVGNEAIFHGYCSASALASLVGDVKTKFKAAGYSGPVTTTEPLNVIQQHGDTLCPVVDVIAANIHPFFNTAVSAILAGPFVANQLKDLGKVCNGQKTAYNLETGWPTGGSSNGLALPGFDAQKIAIKGIMSSAGSRSAVFSFQDDNWKAPGALGVEQKWGCADLFSG